MGDSLTMAFPSHFEILLGLSNSSFLVNNCLEMIFLPESDLDEEVIEP